MREITSGLVIFALLSVISGCSPLHSKSHEGHLCLSNSKWRPISNATIHIQDDTSNPLSKYEFSIYNNSDTLISIQSIIDNKKEEYELWLIEGHSLLSETMKLDYGYEIDYLDMPSLICQLTLTLISLSTDQSPSNFSSHFQNELHENTLPIKVTTQSASGLFSAPWNASLSLEKKENNEIDFRIHFDYSKENASTSKITFTGTLLYLDSHPPSPLDDTKDISPFYQYRIGVLERDFQGRTIFEYGAEEYEQNFKTIKELRDFHKK